VGQELLHGDLGIDQRQIPAEQRAGSGGQLQLALFD
jgi:hypothetical protein